MFCPTPGPWAARTSKDAETQNPGLPLESGRTSGPHRRWGGAVRRTSVLPQAKPWRRGNSLAPSMFNPIGAPIQLAVWGICLTPEPWAARTSDFMQQKSSLAKGRTFLCSPFSSGGAPFLWRNGEKSREERGSLPLDPFSLVVGNLLGFVFFSFGGAAAYLL